MKEGDLVVLTYEGESLAAEVIMASYDEVSLLLAFDGVLGCHAGGMPVLLEPHGYISVITGEACEIAPRH